MRHGDGSGGEDKRIVFHQCRRRGPACRATAQSVTFLFLLLEPAMLRNTLGHTQGRSYVVGNGGCGHSMAMGLV